MRIGEYQILNKLSIPKYILKINNNKYVSFLSIACGLVKAVMKILAFFFLAKSFLMWKAVLHCAKRINCQIANFL